MTFRDIRETNIYHENIPGLRGKMSFMPECFEFCRSPTQNDSGRYSIRRIAGADPKAYKYGCHQLTFCTFPADFWPRSGR
jgi:hypothetical protein